MKKVLFIAYHFPPAGGAPVQRSAKFVKYLPEFGYEPIVLTAGEDRVMGPVRDKSLLDEVAGAKIVRCPGHERLVVDWPRRLRLTPLTSFLLRPDKNVLAWLPAAKRAACRVARAERPDAIYVSAGPYSSILLGARLKRRLGVPLVVDYRDPWTDEPYAAWPTKAHYRFECWQERRALREADAILVVTPTMKLWMEERYPQWAGKIHLVPNGFDPCDLPADRAGPSPGPLQIGFAGSSVEHDMKAEIVRGGPLLRAWVAMFAYARTRVDFSSYSPLYLFRAVAGLLAEEPQWRSSIRLVFAGNFGPANRRLIDELGLSDVVCVRGYVPHAEGVRVLCSSDVLFLALPTSADGRRDHNYSGKIFEYLASGRPILAAVPEGDARDLVHEAKAGWCVEPRDVQGMKALLRDLVRQKQQGPVPATVDPQVVNRFQRRTLTADLARILDHVTQARRPAP